MPVAGWAAREPFNTRGVAAGHYREVAQVQRLTAPGRDGLNANVAAMVAATFTVLNCGQLR